MSTYNDMDFSKFIIKRDDSITDFFRKWDELLTSAKAERLLDYLTGKTHVKPEADVEALNKTRLSFFEIALAKQTKQDESNLTQQIWQLQPTLSILTSQLRKRSTTRELESCTTPTHTWLIFTKKMSQKYHTTMQEEMSNVNHADYLKTLLDTDPTTSTRNWKHNTL
jgi:hypothetical protein